MMGPGVRATRSEQNLVHFYLCIASGSAVRIVSWREQAISNTVAPVKHFLRRTTPSALLRARHFALPENDLPSSTKGSRVISRVELSPTQPSLRSQRDHDYYFGLPP